MALIVHREEPTDRPAVFAVHAAAFARSAEARLADALRAKARPLLSLVAEHAGRVVGHILVSPVTVHPPDRPLILGPGPMGVLPGHQRIGTALVQAGLDRCRELAPAQSSCRVIQTTIPGST